jgi:hypothetical protein
VTVLVVVLSSSNTTKSKMHNHGSPLGERGAFSNNAESSSELPLLCDSKGEVRQNSPMLNLHKTWRGRCVYAGDGHCAG